MYLKLLPVKEKGPHACGCLPLACLQVTFVLGGPVIRVNDSAVFGTVLWLRTFAHPILDGPSQALMHDLQKSLTVSQLHAKIHKVQHTSCMHEVCTASTTNAYVRLYRQSTTA